MKFALHFLELYFEKIALLLTNQNWEFFSCILLVLKVNLKFYLFVNIVIDSYNEALFTLSASLSLTSCWHCKWWRVGMPTKEKVNSRKQIRLVENRLKGAQNMFSYRWIPKAVIPVLFVFNFSLTGSLQFTSLRCYFRNALLFSCYNIVILYANLKFTK
jgi:hypothetical protein